MLNTTENFLFFDDVNSKDVNLHLLLYRLTPFGSATSLYIILNIYHRDYFRLSLRAQLLLFKRRGCGRKFKANLQPGGRDC